MPIKSMSPNPLPAKSSYMEFKSNIERFAAAGGYSQINKRSDERKVMR